MFFSGGDTPRLTGEIELLRKEVERLNQQQAETHRLIETLVLRAGESEPPARVPSDP